MKDKIFQLLKTSYSAMGLGDAVLMAHAQVLDAMGVVTDENIASVIANQKPVLEAIQKNADERATSAQKKASDKLQAEMEALKAIQTSSAEEKKKMEAHIKEMEEKIKSLTPDPEPDPQKKPKFNIEEDEAFQALKSKFVSDLASFQETQKKLTESLTALQSENAQFKAEKASAERANFISSKAKELGIPEWRVNEGFVLAPDATDEAIVNTLTQVANNIKAQVLPDKKTSLPLGENGQVDQSFIKGVARSIIKGI